MTQCNISHHYKSAGAVLLSLIAILASGCAQTDPIVEYRLLVPMGHATLTPTLHPDVQYSENLDSDKLVAAKLGYVLCGVMTVEAPAELEVDYFVRQSQKYGAQLAHYTLVYQASNDVVVSRESSKEEVHMSKMPASAKVNGEKEDVRSYEHELTITKSTGLGRGMSYLYKVYLYVK